MTKASVLLQKYKDAQEAQRLAENALRVARLRTSDAFDAWQSELWKERERANRVQAVDKANSL